MVARRTLFRGAGVTAASATLSAAANGTAEASAPAKTATSSGSAYSNPAGPRARVLIVNDTGGDPDGLFSTAHALLCTSTDVRGIVGTLHGNGQISNSADSSVAKAKVLLKVMRISSMPVYAGSNTRMTSRRGPVDTPGARAIITEANRSDTKLPLYVTVGGNLTEVASAYLLDPSRGGKFTLIWIGGGDYPTGGGEYNFNQDPIAAQVVFNDSTIPIWQVNRHAYVQAMVSNTELQAALQPCGAFGRFLWRELLKTITEFSAFMNRGEAYVLGDSPLVLLSALNQAYDAVGENGTGTSQFDVTYTPKLNNDGTYSPQTAGRKMRVYRTIDSRVLFADLFAKLQLRYGNS